MHDKLTSSKQLRSNYSWRLYVALIVTYSILFWTAFEVHWHSAFVPFSLTSADHGHLIGVSGTVGGSSERGLFRLFDTDLNLLKTVRLRTRSSIGRHGLSSNGSHVVNVDGSEKELLINITSLGTTESSKYITVPVPSDSILSGLMKAVRSEDVRLVGNPPSLAHFQSSGICLIDLDGRVIETLNPLKIQRSVSSDDYLATIEDTKAHLYPEYHAVCYSITPTGFKEIFREPLTWKNRHQINPVLVKNGRLAIQEDGYIRLIDLNASSESKRERQVPWPKIEGELKGISDTGLNLLFETSLNRLLVVSVDTATAVAHLDTPNGIYNLPMPFNDNHAIFVQSSQSTGNIDLVVWDWSNSTTDSITIGELAYSSFPIIDWVFMAVVLVWGAYFFWSSIKSRSLLICAASLLFSITLLILFIHLYPDVEDMGLYSFNSTTIVLIIAWQTLLSLICVLAFRYFSFISAASLTLCVAAGVGYFLHQRAADGTNLYSNIFAVFAISVIVAQSLCLVKNRDRRRLSLIGCVLFMAAIAITIRLLLLGGVGKLSTNWMLEEFGLVGKHNANLQLASVLTGVTHTLLTLLAIMLARFTSRWIFLLQFTIAISLFAFATYCPGNILHPSSENFWIGMIASTAISFVLTWLLLNLVYRFLERPLETSTPSTPTLAMPIMK